ncbi:restriction endonuclease subunit S [Chryseobacterium sp. L7]|uniref:Restriction endonuclease subunit S n=1 Tax=Chryseobacterium endalhagicum TaxID=2797638 RepID=A0ABS1QCA7_9FLAO|nr:restriction endonuclease subunit S [Chryseobacterium endalhagicum]MBL1220274.1 restriction endonuclease subunit S [Chryseobacterium endalhagicum]
MMNDTKMKYKNTSIGIVPTDWEVKSLNKVGEIYSGGTPRTHNPKYWNGEIHWCTPTDITKNSNKYIFKTEKAISHLGLSSSSAKLLPINSIIVSTRASIGKVVINKIEMCTNQGFKNIVPFKEIDFEYLYYNILFLEHVFLKKASGSTFQELSKNDFSKIQIPVPKLPEQKKIAEILSIWDKAIQENNNIIKALEKRNKVLAFSLLTGKKRLKEFKNFQWTKTKLENVIDEYNVKPLSESKLPVFTSSKNGLMMQSDYYSGSRLIDRENVDYNVLPPNYITYRSRSDDGLFTFNKNNFTIKGLISGYYPVFKIKNGNDDFFLYYFNYFKRKLGKYSIGTSQLVLSINALKQITLKIPASEEQNEIAKILNTANEELQQYKQKLENLKQQKKGLMQQLLTGKIRTM